MSILVYVLTVCLNPLNWIIPSTGEAKNTHNGQQNNTMQQQVKLFHWKYWIGRELPLCL